MCTQGNMGEQPLAECFILYKYIGKKHKKNHYIDWPSPAASHESYPLLMSRYKFGTQRTRDAIITSLLLQNDAATSFWCYNDVIIASVLLYPLGRQEPVGFIIISGFIFLQ